MIPRPLFALGPPPEWQALVANHAATIAYRELAERELAKRDFLAFVMRFSPGYIPGWVHHEVAELLGAFVEACERKLSPRLMIFLPPRHGKSQQVSRCLPAFILGKHPEWEVIAGTHTQNFADTLGRDVRAILEDPVYHDLFPRTLIDPRSNAADRMNTTAHGGYVSVGVGTAVVGRGAHVLLIDDPVAGEAAADSEAEREKAWGWYTTEARTRLAPGGGIIVLQQRWHEEDLAGKILAHAKEHQDADQWLVYEFPAIATKDEKNRKEGEALHAERWPIEALKKLRAGMSPRAWSALYQQSPIPDDGIYFKKEWIHTFDALPENVYFYGGSDFAIGTKETNDYTVLVPAAVDADDNLYFTADMVRARLSAFELVEAMVDLFLARQPLYWAVEVGHISKAIGPQLNKRRQERGAYCTSLWEKSPHRDKLARARSLQGRMQQGKVFFHKSLMDRVLPEFLAFPAGKHDDIVDACATLCLMLDVIVRPRALPSLPAETQAAPWSWEDMRSRNPRRGDNMLHRPRSLFSTKEK